MPYFKDQKWSVIYGGGIGPDVWETEIVVTGATAREVLDEVEARVAEAGGEIISISVGASG